MSEAEFMSRIIRDSLIPVMVEFFHLKRIKKIQKDYLITLTINLMLIFMAP